MESVEANVELTIPEFWLLNPGRLEAIKCSQHETEAPKAFVDVTHVLQAKCWESALVRSPPGRDHAHKLGVLATPQ